MEDCRDGHCVYLCVQSRHDRHKSVPAKDPEHRALHVRSDPRGFLWFRVQGEAPVRSCESVNVLFSPTFVALGFFPFATFSK